jgi:hypothetical protein
MTDQWAARPQVAREINFMSMQIEVRECLLSFGAEPFVLQVAIQKLEDQDI